MGDDVRQLRLNADPREQGLTELPTVPRVFEVTAETPLPLTSPPRAAEPLSRTRTIPFGASLDAVQLSTAVRGARRQPGPEASGEVYVIPLEEELESAFAQAVMPEPSRQPKIRPPRHAAVLRPRRESARRPDREGRGPDLLCSRRIGGTRSESVVIGRPRS